MTAVIGLFGKHPGYGDFLRAGLSEPVVEGMSGWLDVTLSALRDETGNDWATFWDCTQELRFWIGRAVLGQTLAGVLRPSRDRVGRRYPLVMLAEGAALPPPVVDPDQGFYDAVCAHLDRAEPGEGGAALLEGLDFEILAEAEQAATHGPTLWAHHPGGDLATLLASVTPVEAERAEVSRSHFWASGGAGRAAVWLAGPGLPTPSSLGWLLAGVAAENAEGAQ